MGTETYVEFNISELPIGHIEEEKVYGFDSQQREIKPLAFKGSVGEIEGYREAYGDLFKEGSLTAGEITALFNTYLLAKRGMTELAEPQEARLNHLFDRVGYGNILETVVDFDNGDKSMKKRKDSDRRIMLIDRPVLVVENGMIREAKGGERKPKIWPGNGYVGRTCDGAYDEDGVPLETWETRAEAEQTWLDIGADEDFAGDAVSYAWSIDEGEGKAIVRRRFFYNDYGRFFLSADGYPGSWDDDVGRVPTSRYD